MSEHRQALVDLVKAHGWRRGAELGVDRGLLFGALLRECPNLHLTGVDLFPDAERSHRVFDREAGFSDRCEVLKMSTNDASVLFEDGTFDFVFIDADHSYEAVRTDIERWTPKVRKGGWIGGHDFHGTKFPGVVKAVRQAFG